nr:protoheme IX farnesyltransferase-like isoform X3 [Cherax quadricarinatus]
MCSIVLARGLHALGLASEIAYASISCSKSPVPLSSKLCFQESRFRYQRCLHRRCKSSVMFLKTGHSQDSDDVLGGNNLLEVVQDVPLRRASSTEHDKNVKVLLIEKSSKLKALTSKEAPLLHHAHAGAVVDMRNVSAIKGYLTNEQGAVEVHLQVEQLLKDSRQSVQSTTNIQPYEDIEYLEETKDNAQEGTQLVGALPPGALDWKPMQINVRKLGSYYAGLSKSRLTGLVSPLHAICFAAVCSTAGIGLLYLGTNGVAASLGTINLLLYTCVYTPMKRLSIVNTWVGAVVGAIPPLIGWASCTGNIEVGGWIMASILFAWQFPHFNALSWNLRADYSRAGYRMMSVTNPALCRRVALRYSLAIIGICTLAPVTDVTTWIFAVDSLPLNGYLVYLAWRFYKDADSKSSRKLFLFTLLHLPAVMVLMIISKKYYNKNKKLETEKTHSSTIKKLENNSKISDGVIS